MSASPRILVVEDEMIVAEDLSESLRSLGYGICGAAASGEDAVNMALRLMPDLVLMDIILHGKMDGIEAAKSIRDHLNIPIIFLTAYADNETVDRAKLSEPYGYLTKPFAEKELHASIQTALHRHMRQERRVEERTAELLQWNAELKEEVRERKVAEEVALRDFRELADLLPQSVYEVDSNGCFSFMNKACLEMIGCTWDDIRRGMYAADVFAGEDRDRVVKNMGEIMKGRHTRGNEYTLCSRQGLRVPVMTYSSPIVRDSTIVGLRGVAVDVSHLQQMEAQLRHAQKMQAVGTLAGGVAHDFNNVLSPIRMSVEMALEEVGEGSEVSRYLHEIRIAAQRAADLVGQILAMSRFEEAHPAVVSLGPLIEESVRFLRATLPATIDIRCRINTDRDTIRADSTQIQQVLINLCTNAAHAIGCEGGKLDIELDEVAFGRNAQGLSDDDGPVSQIRLTVRDSGSGMTPEVKERIFEPYFTTKPAGEGSGLGLAIVHGIVRNHRGSIEVESETGKGTTFCICFPLANLSPVQETGAGPKLRTGKERILFVDDEPAIVAVGCKMLRAMGYDVTGTTRSIEALEFFRRGPETFDLVISDIVMPEMTGVRLARSILGIRPDIPFIFTTGYSNQLTLEQAREMGVRSILFKPVGKTEMSDAIRTVLDAPKEA